MKKIITSVMLSAGLSVLAACTSSAKTSAENAGTDAAEDSVSTVYYTSEITPESLTRIYEALGRKAQGRNVAVKISTR